MKQSDKQKQRGLWAFAVLSIFAVLFIWGNSMLSREASGHSSSVISAWLQSILDPQSRIPDSVFHAVVRKVAHFAEFAVLGLCCGGFFAYYACIFCKKHYALPVLIVLAVAVMDEWLQYFTGRGSLVTDVVLDFSGAATGLVLIFLFCQILMRSRR